MGVVVQTANGNVSVSDIGIIRTERTMSYTVCAQIDILGQQRSITVGGRALVELTKICQIMSITAYGLIYIPKSGTSTDQCLPIIYHTGKRDWWF